MRQLLPQPVRSPPAASSDVDEPEDDDEQEMRAQTRSRLPDFTGLRTERYAYIEYVTGERELYDLHADPFQLRNLATTAPPALLSELAAWLAELRVCAGESCRLAEQRPVALAGSGD